MANEPFFVNACTSRSRLLILRAPVGVELHCSRLSFFYLQALLVN